MKAIKDCKWVVRLKPLPPPGKFNPYDRSEKNMRLCSWQWRAYTKNDFGVWGPTIDLLLDEKFYFESPVYKRKITAKQSWRRFATANCIKNWKYVGWNIWQIGN